MTHDHPAMIFDRVFGRERNRAEDIMFKAAVMSIGISALFVTQADAGVIYNWRTESIERGVEMLGQIEFSEQAVRARRALSDFTGFGQPPAGSPDDWPRFFYPNGDGDGDVDLDPDILGHSFSIFDIGGGTISLDLGENRGLFFEISANIAFDEGLTPSGSIALRGEFSGFRLVGPTDSAPFWTAEYGSDGACFQRCLSTGTWVLDPSSLDVAEPGSLALVLTGILGIGVLVGQSYTRMPWAARSQKGWLSCRHADLAPVSQWSP